VGRRFFSHFEEYRAGNVWTGQSVGGDSKRDGGGTGLKEMVIEAGWEGLTGIDRQAGDPFMVSSRSHSQFDLPGQTEMVTCASSCLANPRKRMTLFHPRTCGEIRKGRPGQAAAWPPSGTPGLRKRHITLSIPDRRDCATQFATALCAICPFYGFTDPTI
jgi:hypothetical protein